MSRILYEYGCVDHGRFEAYSTLSDRNQPKGCPVCAKSSDRVQSPGSFSLEGLSGDFPTASDKWAARHEKGGAKSEF